MAVSNPNFRIMYRNLSDLATLSATPALHNVSSMPVDNVKNLDRVKSFRSTAIDANGVLISGEFASQERISGAVIYRHNLRPGDTWRFRGWTGPNKTGTVFDSGAIDALFLKKLGELDTKVDQLVTSVFQDPGWTSAFSRMFFGSVVVQSWEIHIVSNGNPDGYIDVNRIWVARAIAFSRNFGYDFDLDWKDLSTVDLSEAESIKVDKRGSYRLITLTVPRVFDEDRNTMADLIRQSLNSNDVFIDLFPERGGKLERDYTMTAIISDRTPLKTLNINKHSISFTFRET